MLSSSTDNTIKLWDIKTGLCDKTFEGHTDWINQIILFENDTKMLSYSNNEIMLYDMNTNELIYEIKLNT